MFESMGSFLGKELGKESKRLMKFCFGDTWETAGRGSGVNVGNRDLFGEAWDDIEGPSKRGFCTPRVPHPMGCAATADCISPPLEVGEMGGFVVLRLRRIVFIRFKWKELKSPKLPN